VMSCSGPKAGGPTFTTQHLDGLSRKCGSSPADAAWVERLRCARLEKLECDAECPCWPFPCWDRFGGRCEESLQAFSIACSFSYHVYGEDPVCIGDRSGDTWVGGTCCRRSPDQGNHGPIIQAPLARSLQGSSLRIDPFR
jgi:hypothetical protein